MGYESKFYFVKKVDCLKKGNYYWAEIIAMVDMCRLGGGMPKCFKKPTDCYITEYGDKDILKDCYGDPLYEATIPEFLEWLQEAQIRDHNEYRRWDMLKGLAEGFARATGEIHEIKELNVFINKYELDPRWKNVVVLHYGY